MRIMVINPNTSESMTEHIREALMPIKRPDADLTVVCAERGPETIESDIKERETRCEDIEFDLCARETYGDPEKVKALKAEYESLKSELDALMDEWEDAVEGQ